MVGIDKLKKEKSEIKYMAANVEKEKKKKTKTNG